MKSKKGGVFRRKFAAIHHYCIDLERISSFGLMMKLDNYDRQILRIIQENNLLTHSEIGERIALSASSVRRRLRALRRGGAVKADVSILDPGICGITVIVAGAFEQESRESNFAFKERMKAIAEISQCYTVAGLVDFYLIVHSPNLEAYQAWAEEKLMSDPSIRRYDSNVVFSRFKFSTSVPI